MNVEQDNSLYSRMDAAGRAAGAQRLPRQSQATPECRAGMRDRGVSLVVDMRKNRGIRIGATGLDGLEQEIRTLLSTRKGSVPLDRDFGVTWDYVDLPMPDVMPYMIAEIASQLEKYVPRIKVRDIQFKSDDPVEGILQPTVTVEIREKYLADFRGEF